MLDGITTISATTYLNLPSQIIITGGTHNNGTTTLVNSNGSQIIITGNTRNYNQSGQVAVIKSMCFTVSASTSNGLSIDISQAGFTSILGYSVMAIRNTSNASASPNVSVKSVSNTAIVVNIVEANTATQGVLLNLLGGLVNVLSGAPSVYANTVGLSINVMVWGN